MDFARGRHLSTLGILALAAMFAACSQNLGPAPPGGGSRVAVQAESMAGPVLPVAALSAATRGESVWLGTDHGLYRVDLAQDPAVWRPLHGGLYRLDGREAVVSVDGLFLDAASDLALYVHREASPFDTLIATDDGGSTHFSLESPNLLAGRVLGATVLPPTGTRAQGAWLVAQGGGLYVREPRDADWVPSALPASALEWGAIDADRGGAVWASVRTLEGWRLWRSRDSGATFAAVDDSELAARVLTKASAVASAGESVAWADSAGIHASGFDLPLPGQRVVAAALQWSAGRVSWSLIAEPVSSGTRTWVTGRDANVERSHPIDADVRAETLALAPGGAVVARADGSLLRSVSEAEVREFPFAGGELDWGSLGAFEDDRLILGQARSGEVFVGEASDPSSMRSLGTPQFQSEARSVLPDPTQPGAVFAGSFGCFWNDGSSPVWQDRSAGQSNYLFIVFAGPISVQSLAAQPGGPLWLGGVNGNGPYRSLDGGQSWQREHLGLGAPGSIEGEDGLPLCTEVRAFSFDANGTVFMGSFRGGVWRFLSDSRTWVQENEGLPDLAGAPVDTCCLDPDEAQVDVRDLVHLDDGSALAATGWGVYRRADGAARWEPSNFGLTNGDLFAFAVHPSRAEWVVAAGRGTRESPDWIFFSRDRGRTWTPVASSLPARWADDIVWTRGSANELVATLQAQGAWRLVLRP